MTKDRNRLRLSVTHRLAAEIHGALADRGMSIKELSTKIGESENFIKRVLVAEDGIADVVKLSLIADVVWATAHGIDIYVSPDALVKSTSTVKSDTDGND